MIRKRNLNTETQFDNALILITSDFCLNIHESSWWLHGRMSVLECLSVLDRQTHLSVNWEEKHFFV